MAAAFPAVVRQSEVVLLRKFQELLQTTIHPLHAMPYQSNTEFCNTARSVAAGEHLRAQVVIIESVAPATP